ncbi:MAG TPA: tetratricopeptide repeat protein, partial [Thermoanaerobaculia bacterium]|nr:tetratricopeptide repeat protein [Thermoanaerobaculia bacterium]
MPRQDRELYEFEGFVVDPYRRLLTRDGEPVPLPPKALATLVALLERHGQVVEKEELIQTVWPDTFITEATLTQNVFRLRKALGEEAGEHRFIVTIPGRGYSFVAAVRRRAPVLSASGEFPRVELPPPAVPIAQPVTPPASPPIDPAAPPTALPAAPQAPPEEATAPPVAAPTVPDQAPPPRARGLSGLSPAGRLALLGGSILGLILLAMALGFRDPSPSPAPAAPPRRGARTTAVVPRRSVAVLGFRNLSGRNETAWLSTALAEMFTVELGVGEKLHTITGESVTRAKRDLGLGETENLSPETLSQVRGLLGCDIVLLGSFLALGSEGEGKIRVDLRLQDTGSGDTLAVLTGTRTEEQLFELVSELGLDLRRKLGTETASPGDATAATRAAFPTNPEAARLYAEGLEHLRDLDTLAARDLLQRATEAEPSFPLAHAALARAWSTLGYDLNAEQEAARAFELSATLPREDRLLVEALYAETRQEWPKAVEIYESLWRFFPDDLEHGLRLAQAQVTAGQPQRALATTAILRRLPPPLSDDPRIDLSDAEAAAALSDYAQLESSAARAAQKGRSLHARLLVAMALHHQGRALRNLGRTQEALAKTEEAENILAEMGDRVGVARAAHDRANLLRDSGDFEESRRQYERSLAIHRDAGNQRGIIRALTNLAALETQRGDYARAQELLREVVDVSREVHDAIGEAHGLSTLGSLLYDQGDLAGAQRAAEESLRQFRSVGSVVGEASARMSLAGIRQDLGRLRQAQAEAETALALSRKIRHKRSMASALRHLGQILLDQGRVEEARAAFQEMKGLAEQTGHKLLLASARSGLASIRHVQGDLAGARAEQTEVLELWKVTDERQQGALGQLALARIARDEGKSAEAERETRNAAEHFRDLRLRNGEALAHELLALTYLDRGDPGGAKREIDAALDLTASSQNRRIRLSLAVTAGRVGAALGKTGEARQELTAGRAEATTLGFRLTALDAAIGLAEIELHRGDAEAGRAALRTIQQDATRLGLRLLAERAER